MLEKLIDDLNKSNFKNCKMTVTFLWKVNGKCLSIIHYKNLGVRRDVKRVKCPDGVWRDINSDSQMSTCYFKCIDGTNNHALSIGVFNMRNSIQFDIRYWAYSHHSLFPTKEVKFLCVVFTKLCA